MRLSYLRFAAHPSSRLGPALCVELQGLAIDSREVPGRQARIRHIGMKRRCAPCVQRSATADRTMKACTRSWRGSRHAPASIIDLAAGHQPIHNEDRTVWVVFNGEIYNYASSARELEARGHRFYTSTTPKRSSTPTRSGATALRAAPRHVRRRHLGQSRSDAAARARPRRIKPLYYAEPAAGCFSAPRSSRCSRPAEPPTESRHSTTICVSVHAARRLDLPGVRSCRPGSSAGRTAARGPAVLGRFRPTR